MSVEIWKHLAIDRIGITIPVPNIGMFNFVKSQMVQVAISKKELFPGGEVKPQFTNDGAQLWFNSSKSKRRIAEIILSTTKSKYRYIKLSLYPSRYSGAEFDQLKKILSECLQHPYEVFYESGRVSYLELAADTLSHAKHTFIPFRAYCTKSKAWSYGFGTIWVGSEKGNCWFAIYDKQKQLIDNKLPAPHKQHTRIEARLRDTGLSPSALVSLPNPFIKLEIADFIKAKLISKSNEWNLFLLKCVSLGAQAALTLFKKWRKKFLILLRSSAASWWEPEYIWQYFAQALKTIAP